LTDNHKLLLAKGLARGERTGEVRNGNPVYTGAILYTEDAKELYSSEDAAISALVTLRFKGFIDITDMPGHFQIRRAPEDVQLCADRLREQRHRKQKTEDAVISE
jgi:hypothetical protein